MKYSEIVTPFLIVKDVEGNHGAALCVLDIATILLQGQIKRKARLAATGGRSAAESHSSTAEYGAAEGCGRCPGSNWPSHACGGILSSRAACYPFMLKPERHLEKEAPAGAQAVSPVTPPGTAGWSMERENTEVGQRSEICFDHGIRQERIRHRFP